MKITSDGNRITISGMINSQEDYEEMKEKFMEVVNSGVKDIIVFTPEPFSFTSSVVGFFTKIIFRDKVYLTMYIKDRLLYGLMEDLNLIETFNIKKDF